MSKTPSDWLDTHWAPTHAPKIVQDPNPKEKDSIVKESKSEAEPKKEAKSKDKKTDAPENAGTTSLGALLQAKLDDQKKWLNLS